MTVRVATGATILAVALCIVGVAASGRAVPKTHTVTIEGMRFQPQTLTVSRGDTIVWVNKDPFPHTATSAGNFDSALIQPDQSWTFTPKSKGAFTYICSFHPTTMKGTLRVQ